MILQLIVVATLVISTYFMDTAADVSGKATSSYRARNVKSHDRNRKLNQR